jgi:riboflavin kinase/FMN adenylyltransferase
VQYGDQIGRTLNFPTINVRLNRHKPCLSGIYAVDVVCESTSLRDKVQSDDLRVGIAGYQPTVYLVQVMSEHAQPFNKNIQNGD